LQQALNALRGAELATALVCLGVLPVTAQEFITNGITSLARLRALTSEALDTFIKQIHRDNQGQGFFIPFIA